MPKLSDFPVEITEHSELLITNESNGWTVHVGTSGTNHIQVTLRPKFVFTDPRKLSDFICYFGQCQQDGHYKDGV